jgi:hypothetical protein
MRPSHGVDVLQFYGVRPGVRLVRGDEAAKGSQTSFPAPHRKRSTPPSPGDLRLSFGAELAAPGERSRLLT